MIDENINNFKMAGPNLTIILNSFVCLFDSQMIGTKGLQFSEFDGGSCEEVFAE